jgi:hypothetical protein
MISKCANPKCPKELMRLDGGRFYGFHTSSTAVEHFWLCVDCCRAFTLKMKAGRVELEPRQRKRA